MILRCGCALSREAINFDQVLKLGCKCLLVNNNHLGAGERGKWTEICVHDVDRKKLKSGAISPWFALRVSTKKRVTKSKHKNHKRSSLFWNSVTLCWNISHHFESESDEESFRKWAYLAKGSQVHRFVKAAAVDFGEINFLSTFKGLRLVNAPMIMIARFVSSVCLSASQKKPKISLIYGVYRKVHPSGWRQLALRYWVGV